MKNNVVHTYPVLLWFVAAAGFGAMVLKIPEATPDLALTFLRAVSVIAVVICLALSGANAIVWAWHSRNILTSEKERWMQMLLNQYEEAQAAKLRAAGAIPPDVIRALKDVDMSLLDIIEPDADVDHQVLVGGMSMPRAFFDKFMRASDLYYLPRVRQWSTETPERTWADHITRCLEAWSLVDKAKGPNPASWKVPECRAMVFKKWGVEEAPEETGG